MKNKKLIMILSVCGGVFALLLVGAVVIGGWFAIRYISDVADAESSDLEQNADELYITAMQEEFDALSDELFEQWVTSSTLMINTFLADPEGFGIARPEPTFGIVTNAESIEEDRREMREFIERFAYFEHDLLRDDQRIIYEILARNIDIYLAGYHDDNVNYFRGIVRPFTGFQVVLPILLAEFNFHMYSDIEEYLSLLPDIIRYFDDIIEFETERAGRGFFMSEYNSDNVISQLEDFLENRDDNILITIFNDKIDEFPGISDGDREQYKARNKELVFDYVFVAYENLLGAMRELRGVGVNEGGLAALPGGREYAYRALRRSVGTDRTPEELADLLYEWIISSWVSLIHILQTNPELNNRLMRDELGQIEPGTPEEYVYILRNAIVYDFPPPNPNTRLIISEIHESLQEHTSAAFYRMPALDAFDDNLVYFNPSALQDNLLLFIVLAHETYPGHLYQTTYFLGQNPHPVRNSLRNLGYVEGWATYIEMISYTFTGLDSDEIAVLWSWQFLVNNLIPSKIDLMVNLFNWDINDVYEFTEQFNLNTPTYVELVFSRVTGNPLFFLDYSLGFIEMVELRSIAEERFGENFELIEFHRFVLDFGPAPFPIIRRHMEDWMAHVG